jgi:hypothetical protein
MRPTFWHDRRVGDNVVRVHRFHNAPQRLQGHASERAHIIILEAIRIERRDYDEPDKRERPPP